MNLVLKNLSDFFGGHYHQDVWDDFDSDMEIWADYKIHVSQEKREMVINEINELLATSDEQIVSFLNDATYFGGIDFENATDGKEFLHQFKKFLND